MLEQVAKRLTDGWGTKAQPLTIPTLLTQGNRSAGRDGVRVKTKREAKRDLTVPAARKACGVILGRQDRDHCEDCMPEEVRAGAMAFREKGGRGSKRCAHPGRIRRTQMQRTDGVGCRPWRSGGS